MNTTVKILLLEDYPSDAELIKIQIKKSGIKFNLLHVSEYDAFVEAINSYTPDIILSDYNLGGFTGIDALYYAKKTCPLVPFIIVTGTINEETAAETIKAGAWDYVVKQRLKRLDSAIYNALSLKQEKKEKEVIREKLRNYDKKLLAIKQTANDAIITVNDEGIIDDWNNAAEKIFGYLSTETRNKQFTEIIPDRYRTDIELAFERVNRGDLKKIIGNTIELIGLHKDGTEFPIELSLSTWKVNKQRYYTGLIRNISERKRAEQIQKVLYNISNATNNSGNLHELVSIIRQELGALIDTSNFYIALYEEKTDTFTIPYLADEKDDSTTFNASKSLTNYVRKSQKSLLANCGIVDKMIKNGDIAQVEQSSGIWLGIPLNISSITIGVIAVQSYVDENAYSEADKKILEFVSEQISISIERKKNEDNLHKALAKATESDLLKSAFLANMSHEIRTPMNGIVGFAELLKDPDLDGEEIQEYINIISQSSDRMLKIINNIISISKIESGLMELCIEELNINEQCNYIYNFFKPKIESKGIQLLLKNSLLIGEDSIKTDKEKLNSILTNLVGNAIKFTDQGTIEVACVRKDNFLEFYIKDTGIGIDSNRQKEIFKRFIQADISDNRAYQGAGLGLSISKAYIEKLGGKIWIESKKGIGSTFYFTIPCDTETKVSKNVENVFDNADLETQKKNLKILIVEDDESSSQLLEIMIAKISREILHANNGQEAIIFCQNNSDIDLILMDVQMPVMGGYEATQKIRQFNKDTIIIAQTAHSMTDDKERAISSGCNDHISKPIVKDKLLALINKFLTK